MFMSCFIPKFNTMFVFWCQKTFGFLKVLKIVQTDVDFA